MKTIADITPVLKDINSHLRRDDHCLNYFKDAGEPEEKTFYFRSDNRNTIYSDDEVNISIAAKMIGFALRGKDEFAFEYVNVHGPSYCWDSMGYADDMPFQCFAQATVDLLERYLPETPLTKLKKLADTAVPGFDQPLLTEADITLYRTIFKALIKACEDIVKQETGTKNVPSFIRAYRVINPDYDDRVQW